MALVKCRECAREISDQAAVCPHCGIKGAAQSRYGKASWLQTLRKKTLAAPGLAFGLFLVLLVALTASFDQSGNKPSSTTAPSTSALQPATDTLASSNQVLVANNVPDWQLPKPGTSAFIGVSGEHAQSAVVCKTLSEFNEHEEGTAGDPPGCVKFKSGTPAIIEGLMYDVSVGFNPIAKILIPSVKYSGFITLSDGLVPVVPIGTSLTVQDSIGFSLAKSQNEMSYSGEIFYKARIKILKQNENLGQNGYDLYVSINGHNSEKGWILSDVNNAGSNNMLGEFQYSILGSNQNIPASYLLKNSPSTWSNALADEGDVAPFNVPRGAPDFRKFTNYYSKAAYSAGAAVRCGFKSKEWETQVVKSDDIFLARRGVYDFQPRNLATTAIENAATQLDGALSSGNAAPAAICMSLKNSSGYNLANAAADLGQ